MIPFRKETGYTILAQVLSLILGIGASIVLNRTLGPAGKGEFVILFLIPQLIVAFINLGMGTSASYFMGKKLYRENEIVTNTLIFTLIVGILGAFIGYYFIKGVSKSPLYINLLVLSMVICGLWANFTGEFFMGKGKMNWYNFWNLLQIGGRFLVLIGLLGFFTNKLYGAVISIVLLNVSLFLISLFVLYKVVCDGSPRLSPRSGKLQLNVFTGKYFKDAVGFGYKIFILEALGFLVFRVDNFLLKIFADNVQIGYYSTAVYMAETLWLVPRAVYYVLYSKAVGDRSSPEIIERFTRLSLWATIILGLLSLVVVKPIILLFYGQAFLPSLKPYIILLPGIISFTISLVLAAQIIGGWGRPEILIPGRIGAVILNIILNLFLIPKWGMNGAALVSTITYFCNACYYVVIYTKISKKSIREILVLKREDIKSLLKLYIVKQ